MGGGPGAAYNRCMHLPRPGRSRLALTAVVAATTGSLLVPAAPAAALVSVPFGTFIVTYDAPPSPADLAVLSGLTDTYTGLSVIPAALVTVDLARLPLLRGLPGVRGVYPNERYQPLMASATATSRASQVWQDLGVTGAGVSIAVIDAGVDGAHPDLCARVELCRGTPIKVVQNVKAVGREDKLPGSPVLLLEDQISTDSSSGHGSHVAGIAAGWGSASETPGKFRGVAHGASIVGYGTGEALEAVNVLASWDHALRNRDRYNIRVINNSWGPGAFTDYDPEHPVNRATDASWDAGVSVTFGSGNDGTRTDSLNMFSAHPKAMSIAGGRKDGHQAFFSSKGIPGNPLWHPTVMAPGENIVSVQATTGFTIVAANAGAGSANPEQPVYGSPDATWYATSSGTSMASPHVAGIVALMQEAAHAARGVWLTPLEVRNILQNTARPMTPQYQHYTTGAGYVDAYAAVQAAQAGTHTHEYDDGTTYDVVPFTGTVGPGAVVSTSQFESTYTVLPGATSLDVMVDWGPEKVLPANQDVDIDLIRPDGSTFLGTFLRCDAAAQPNGYSSFCSSAPNERLSVAHPAAGTWRVVVHAGAATAQETVRGLWSAAYPDGTVVPAAQAVASLTLEASAPAMLAGQAVDLTATARNAAGLPVPNVDITWSSTGAGEVTNREPVTETGGRAVAAARSVGPGTQTVTVSGGGLTATVSITWLGVVLPPPPACVLSCPPPPPPNNPGAASGGGHWVDGARRHLAVSAEYNAGAASPGGSLSYSDKAGTVVEADVVERFWRSGASATLEGPARVNGNSGYRYSLTVTDNGEPGAGADTVRLVVTATSGSYRHETSGTLTGGNIQVR